MDFSAYQVFLNEQAVLILIIGLMGVAVFNAWMWRGDRALVLRLASQPEKPVILNCTPKVSILVAAWNEAELIEQHIQSILSLHYPNKEYILCAGGNDGTYELARNFARVGVIVLEQLAGEGKQRALRRGLEWTSGEIVFLTDADCELSDDAFERTLSPLINEKEVVATGTSEPLSTQQENPFVVYQWAIQAYNVMHSGIYSPGLLGRNCAVEREALITSGGFERPVSAGTDYYLARQLMSAGFHIRMVAESKISSEYLQGIGSYVRQRSRWLRNLYLHGRMTGDNFHVRHALTAGLIGLSGFGLPIVAMLTHRMVWGIWLLWLAYGLAARLRYLSAARKVGIRIPWATAALVPVWLFADWLAWTQGLVEVLVPSWHGKW